jgi:5-methylcytosine-specific restriction endonuclease McrA
MTATTRTLVLDSAYAPHRVVSWQRAAMLLHLGRAEVVELYDETIRAVSREVARSLEVSRQMLTWFELGVDDHDPDAIMYVLRVPAVIRLLCAVGRKRAVKFSRINVLTRDGFRCQYCGTRKPMSDLNFDHVVPRSRGGKTTFENVVASCIPCNSFKRDRTPEQAGMTLLRTPVRPRSLPIAGLRAESLRDAPELWRSWLYWNVELEP